MVVGHYNRREGGKSAPWSRRERGLGEGEIVLEVGISMVVRDFNRQVGRYLHEDLRERTLGGGETVPANRYLTGCIRF